MTTETPTRVCSCDACVDGGHYPSYAYPTPRMNRVVKAMWTKSLRDGDFDQGTFYLTSRDADGHEKHCCLGVLCVIADVPRTLKEVNDPGWDADGGGGDGAPARYAYGIEGSTGTLPSSLAHDADLQSPNPNIPELRDRANLSMDLTTLNDSEEFTFDQIADIIDYFL